MTIAIAFIDNVGRRKLLLAGLVGMAVSLAVVEMAFGSLVVFTTSFAFPLGPVVWAVINEVFPAQIRSRGVALSGVLPSDRPIDRDSIKTALGATLGGIRRMK